MKAQNALCMLYLVCRNNKVRKHNNDKKIQI